MSKHSSSHVISFYWSIEISFKIIFIILPLSLLSSLMIICVHITRWPSPAHAGMFIAGMFYTMLCFYLLLMPCILIDYYFYYILLLILITIVIYNLILRNKLNTAPSAQFSLKGSKVFWIIYFVLYFGSDVSPINKSKWFFRMPHNHANGEKQRLCRW